MATNTKRGNPDHVENSELEVMRAKIKKLEAKVEELQRINNGQVDHHEDQKNDVVDFLLEFMNNNGFKQIAYKILSFLDRKSFFLCRSVCRSWRDFIDNEWSMLQMQLFHLNEEISYKMDFDPLIKLMKENPDKSELRVFIKMVQELASKRCSFKLELHPEKYMIDHHRHQELKILLLYPEKKDESSGMYTSIFKYACQYGCEICVKLLLDLAEEKEIDFNLVKKWDRSYNEPHEYEHCLFVALTNLMFKTEVVDLLLRSSEEKGIDIYAKDSKYGETMRDKIIFDLQWGFLSDKHTEATYKILKIDPSVHLKRRQ